MKSDIIESVMLQANLHELFILLKTHLPLLLHNVVIWAQLSKHPQDKLDIANRGTDGVTGWCIFRNYASCLLHKCQETINTQSAVWYCEILLFIFKKDIWSENVHSFVISSVAANGLEPSVTSYQSAVTMINEEFSILTHLPLDKMTTIS